MRTAQAVRGVLILMLCASCAISRAHAASLDSLAWMSGSWAGRTGEEHQEEHWTAPSGGLMLSVHRDVTRGRAVSFEFLRIVQRGDSLLYVAMPRGRNETPFPLKELGPRRVVFENPAIPFPTRILYWQEKPGELRARIEGTIQGKPASEEWTWTRSSLVPGVPRD